MKNKILIYVVLVFIVSFSFISLILPDKIISQSERRYLKKFPTFELSSNWIGEVDKYFLDHFVLRDSFRSIKAYYNYNVLGMLTNNDVFIKDNYIFKSDYPTNNKSLVNFKNNTFKMIENFGENNNIYIMIIPDKNYYINDDNFLKIDYDYIYNEVENLGLINIDLRDVLKLNDFYETDTHWREEKLDKVVYKMSTIMDFDYNDIEYIWKEYNNFYGVLYGESALFRKAEKLIYLANENFPNINVSYLENKDLSLLFNEDKLTGLDSYDVYLDGASSFIHITNNDLNNNRELIVFRDSFGSSLVPLLINYYEKIYVIDNRYIASNNFTHLIDFNNKDILFLYSTVFLNNSFSLKG